MKKEIGPHNRSIAERILPLILVAIWAILLAFAFVAAKDPPWLRQIAEIGHSGEAADMKSYGDNFLRQANYPMAITHYRKALEIQPDNPGAMANLAMAYHRIGESDKGLKLLEKALIMKSGRKKPLYYNMGEIFFDQHKYEEAIAAYLIAIDSEIDQDLLFHKLGKAYMETGQLEKARDAFEKMLQIETDPLTPYVNMVRKSLAVFENDTNSIKVLKTIPLNNINSSDLEDYDLDFVIQCNLNNPGLGSTYKNLATVYFALGDTAKGIEYSGLAQNRADLENSQQRSRITLSKR